jgi:SAM-dependent methyltransferase
MSASFDPFGTAVLEYLKNNSEAEIVVESDLTEEDVIPVQYLFRSVEFMPEKELFALSLSKGKILDVGAGAGSHALDLQSRGNDVTALDISEKCCEAMKSRGIKSVLKEDFFLLPETVSYDTLLFLMNGFGIAGTLEKLDALLKKSYALLAPGGLLIGESADVLYLFEEEDGSYSIDLNAGYYGEMNYRMHYKEESGAWFPWLYVSMELLIEMAEQNNFRLKEFFEGENDDFVVCFEKV